ncbi:MAG: tryptophan--tRNA ligase [Candidatus Omnitrophica bacterium]|nr:tryptophan--tRNA ligase [Candidatus Omnitrophota bacterium]
MKKIIYSAMRPTGKLHLGHLVGALKNWKDLQDKYCCIFGIADWHALMGEYENSDSIKENTREMVLDWLSCGLDPQKSVFAVQSEVAEHLELHIIFSCITPLGWLERNPTYKEQLREIKTRDLQTYGFLGYPVLQAADILVYRANAVPIGEDQLPHLELTREIGRRFNHIFKTELFPDCEPILTKTPRLLGLDGRKMSKSYQNTINLSDSSDEVSAKVKGMFTDPLRIKLSDCGHPDKCNVFEYYSVFAPEKKEEVFEWCSKAKKGCTDCKKELGLVLNQFLGPIRDKRENFCRNNGMIEDILSEGTAKAKTMAKDTMKKVREVVF